MGQVPLRAFTCDEWLSHIKSFENASTIQDIINILGRNLGFHAGITQILPSVVAKHEQVSDRFLYHNIPEKLIDLMNEKYSGQVDPIAKAVLDYGTALWLSDLYANETLYEAKDKPYIKKILECLGDGICVPTHLKGYSGYCFCSYGRAKAECDEALLWQVQTLCNHAHFRYYQFRSLVQEKAKLTNRELNVLELLALGKTNKEIAEVLGITKNTVGGYVAQIYIKLDVQDRVSAAFQAMHMDLVR